MEEEASIENLENSPRKVISRHRISLEKMSLSQQMEPRFRLDVSKKMMMNSSVPRVMKKNRMRRRMPWGEREPDSS